MKIVSLKKIPLDDLDERNKLLETNDGEDEKTSILDRINRRFKSYNRILSKREIDAIEIEKFLNSRNIDLPSEYINKKFIKYLMDKHDR